MKKPLLLISIVLFSLLFVFATNKDRANITTPVNTAPTRNPETENAALFAELHLSDAGMTSDVFNSAMSGLEKLDEKGAILKDNIITIIDFSQPSNKKRLYVLDLLNRQLLFNTLVAHGRNSGTLETKSFSNDLSSLKSSPGFYVTGETYRGENGFSLRLDGLEKDINDHARERSIVMHGAPYVNEATIHSLGFLGRSLGCPAVPLASHKAIINTIKEGTCLFIYSPDTLYRGHSTVLNS